MKNDLGGGPRRAQAPMTCYGCAGVNWAVIPVHLLILGTSKYLENDGAPVNTGISISETTSQRKDGPYTVLSSIDDCKPALHSHSLERNMCIPEHPMKKH